MKPSHLYQLPVGSWAAAGRGPEQLERGLGALLAVGCLLFAVHFGGLLAQGDAVRAAAREGAREAALPGASDHTIRAAVRRQLAHSRAAPCCHAVVVEKNGQPVRGGFRPSRGDLVAVTVEVAAARGGNAGLLGWLGVQSPEQMLSSRCVMRVE